MLVSVAVRTVGKKIGKDIPKNSKTLLNNSILKQILPEDKIIFGTLGYMTNFRFPPFIIFCFIH